MDSIQFYQPDSLSSNWMPSSAVRKLAKTIDSGDDDWEPLSLTEVRAQAKLKRFDSPVHRTGVSAMQEQSCERARAPLTSDVSCDHFTGRHSCDLCPRNSQVSDSRLLAIDQSSLIKGESGSATAGDVYDVFAEFEANHAAKIRKRNIDQGIGDIKHLADGIESRTLSVLSTPSEENRRSRNSSTESVPKELKSIRSPANGSTPIKTHGLTSLHIRARKSTSQAGSRDFHRRPPSISLSDEEDVIDNNKGDPLGSSATLQQQGPPPIYSDDTQYYVNCLLDRRVFRSRSKKVTKYLVQWLGYGPEHNSWVQEDEIHSGLIKEYQASTIKL